MELPSISCPRATHYALKVEKPFVSCDRRGNCLCLLAWPHSHPNVKEHVLLIHWPRLTHDQHAHPTVTHRTHDTLQNSFLIIKWTPVVPLHFYSLLFFLGRVWPRLTSACHSVETGPVIFPPATYSNPFLQHSHSQPIRYTQLVNQSLTLIISLTVNHAILPNDHFHVLG